MVTRWASGPAASTTTGCSAGRRRTSTTTTARCRRPTESVPARGGSRSRANRASSPRYPGASMVDPRIYRGFLVAVAFAVIVFGFSLQSQPHGMGTTVAPGQFFTDVQATMSSLDRYADRAPGSTDDNGLAATVASDLRQLGGFNVQTQTFEARTTAGRRLLENVVATRAGLGSGTVVVVSHRDALSSPGTADLYSTAVLLDLARALSGETLNRSVMLVSTSGQIGTAGATQLAKSLAGQQVDGVIVLGDLG